jgi:hypothetical protein
VTAPTPAVGGTTPTTTRSRSTPNNTTGYYLAVIVEALTDLAVPIGNVTPLDGNPRKGDVDAVARSLKRFGQRKPIIATVDGTIIAGNHTHAAAVRLGWSEIAVVYVDDNDTEAKAFALADNRTADLGTYDNNSLIELMASVAATDLELLEAASYTSDDLHDLMSYTQPGGFAGNKNPDLEPGEQDNTTGHTGSGLVCPKCGHHL